jgi:hypothetical protein
VQRGRGGLPGVRWPGRCTHHATTACWHRRHSAARDADLAAACSTAYAAAHAASCAATCTHSAAARAAARAGRTAGRTGTGERTGGGTGAASKGERAGENGPGLGDELEGMRQDKRRSVHSRCDAHSVAWPCRADGGGEGEAPARRDEPRRAPELSCVSRRAAIEQPAPAAAHARHRTQRRRVVNVARCMEEELGRAALERGTARIVIRCFVGEGVGVSVAVAAIRCRGRVERTAQPCCRATRRPKAARTHDLQRRTTRRRPRTRTRRSSGRLL